MKRSRLFEELIIKSWWAILFFLFCFFIYDQAIKRLLQEEQKLKHKLTEMIREKQSSLVRQEELQQQIASQNDKAFIELILMRRLGLVPEGQIKVHFIPNENAP